MTSSARMGADAARRTDFRHPELHPADPWAAVGSVSTDPDQALHMRVTHDVLLSFDAMRFSGSLGQAGRGNRQRSFGLYWLGLVWGALVSTSIELFRQRRSVRGREFAG